MPAEIEANNNIVLRISHINQLATFCGVLVFQICTPKAKIANVAITELMTAKYFKVHLLTGPLKRKRNYLNNYHFIKKSQGWLSKIKGSQLAKTGAASWDPSGWGVFLPIVNLPGKILVGQEVMCERRVGDVGTLSEKKFTRKLSFYLAHREREVAEESPELFCRCHHPVFLLR